MDVNIKKFMSKLRKMPDFDRVKFIILYGSQASGKANKMSDYDFAVYFDGDKDERFKFLININFDLKYDAKIFQDLPLLLKKTFLRAR